MKKIRLNFAGILSVIMILGYILGVFYQTGHIYSSYKAQNGLLDLHQWDSAAQPVVSLDGEWSFYPGHLVGDSALTQPGLPLQVPGTWEVREAAGKNPLGFGTYRLQVSGLQPETVYGFKIQDQVTAYRLWINGQVVAGNGTVGRTPETSVPQWLPVTDLFQTDAAGTAEFTMEISNFSYPRGGFWNRLIIGEPSHVIHYKTLKAHGEMFLFSGLFMIGVFFLGLFSLHAKERATFYFALFCLSMSLHTFMTGERLILDFMPPIPWELAVRLEYLFGYCLLPLFGLYMTALLPGNGRQRQSRFFQGLLLCAALLPLLTPHLFYATLIDGYKYLAMTCAVYFLVIIGQAIYRKQSDAYLMLLALLALMLGIAKDTFWENEFSAVNYAAYLFMICFSLSTIEKYAGTQKKNEILESKVVSDPLTGLYNREYAENCFDAFRRSSFYLLFLDLDNFKAINDTYGHDVGDVVLKSVSRRLERQVRSDDVICRYGGDEFLILIRQDDDVVISQIAQRIIQAVADPVAFHGGQCQTGVSIGISRFTEGSGGFRELIRRSDKAMYEAKQRGGNTFVEDSAESLLQPDGEKENGSFS